LSAAVADGDVRADEGFREVELLPEIGGVTSGMQDGFESIALCLFGDTFTGLYR
jgi:hypothetical protein